MVPQERVSEYFVYCKELTVIETRKKAIDHHPTHSRHILLRLPLQEAVIFFLSFLSFGEPSWDQSECASRPL